MDVFEHIFNLPANCVFHTIVPKNTFEKTNTLTVAEKRLIAVSFLPLQSVLSASLAQPKSFIPPLSDQNMDYEDILFFTIKLKPEHLEKYSNKLTQLYQKYIPKPCIILLHDDFRFRLNTALKEFNEADNNKRVVLEQLTTPIITIADSRDEVRQFTKQLSFENIDKQNLKTAHQSYARSIVNFKIAEKTGKIAHNHEVAENAQRLREIEKIERELNVLRNHIRKSNQLSDKIESKLQFSQKRKYLEQLKDSL